jgi:drug/metabolite transporter (DMT)-like permease
MWIAGPCTRAALLMMSSPRVRFSLPIALLIAVLAVSTASIFIRFAQTQAPSLVIAALRLTLASLALAPLALTRHRPELRELKQADLWLAILSGLFLAAHFATWITSLEYTSVASSVVLVSTGPLWVALLSPLVLHEPLTRPILIGMGLALLGGVFIALSDACTWSRGLVCPSLAQILQGRMMFGNFLALFGAWMVAGYLMIGRKLRAQLSLVAYIFLVYSTAAVALLLAVKLAGQSLLGYDWTIYAWIALLALLPQLIGHSTYNWALAYLPAAFVAVMTLGEPIGSSILAYFILQEAPSLPVMAGGGLILAGIYLAVRGSNLDPTA